MKEEAKAEAYIVKAMRLYKKWGAMAKVDQIRKLLPSGVEPPIDIEEGTLNSNEKSSNVASANKGNANVSSASGSNPSTEQSSAGVASQLSAETASVKVSAEPMHN